MSMHDPIADMLTQIKNGQARARSSVTMPASKLKVAIAGILKEEGYISDFQLDDSKTKQTMSIELKYFDGKPVIELLKRASKPSLRKYSSSDDLPKVMGGLGTAIVSTSKGVMTDKKARSQGIGGEILCYVA